MNRRILFLGPAAPVTQEARDHQFVRDGKCGDFLFYKMYTNVPPFLNSLALKQNFLTISSFVGNEMTSLF